MYILALYFVFPFLKSLSSYLSCNRIDYGLVDLKKKLKRAYIFSTYNTAGFFISES